MLDSHCCFCFCAAQMGVYADGGLEKHVFGFSDVVNLFLFLLLLISFGGFSAGCLDSS